MTKKEILEHPYRAITTESGFSQSIYETLDEAKEGATDSAGANRIPIYIYKLVAVVEPKYDVTVKDID